MQIKTDKASISLPHSDLVVLSVSLLLEYPTINYPPFFMINQPEPMQNAKEEQFVAAETNPPYRK